MCTFIIDTVRDLTGRCKGLLRPFHLVVLVWIRIHVEEEKSHKEDALRNKNLRLSLVET